MIFQYIKIHGKEITILSVVAVLVCFTWMNLLLKPHMFSMSKEIFIEPSKVDCKKEIDDFVPLKEFLSFNSSWHYARHQKILERQSLEPGGHFMPEKCGNQSEFRTLILVPYRDRASNLIRFLSYMHSFLQRQGIEYQIFIISQAMSPYVEFNRGALFNIGFKLAMHWPNSSWDCVIFHDVDHLPENEDNIYTCWDVPRHMNSNDNHAGQLPYPKYFGGVSAMKPAHYIQINGFSNRFFGWGGEDDDVQKRITQVGLKWKHNNMTTGSYLTLKHNNVVANDERFDLLKRSEKMMIHDGLNSIKFTLLSLKIEKLFVNVSIVVEKNN